MYRDYSPDYTQLIKYVEAMKKLRALRYLLSVLAVRSCSTFSLPPEFSSKTSLFSEERGSRLVPDGLY